jgi:preprotein translocase subunit SecG
MLRVILTIVQVFACFAIIGLVLLQRGKGADAGAGFGAGASGTVFGARGAATALSRATAFFAAIFMINSLLLTYVSTRVAAAPASTILDTVGQKAAPGAPAPGTAIPVTPPPASSPAPTSSQPATGAATDGSATTPAPAPAATPAPAAAPASTPTPAPPASETPPSGTPPK